MTHTAHDRRPRRGRRPRGRAVAVLAAAAALIGAFQVVESAPAQALPPGCNIDLFSSWDTNDNCFDELLAELVGTGGFIIPVPPNMPPRPPEAPPEPVMMLDTTQQAKQDAIGVLSNPKCLQLITGTNPSRGRDAKTVLENIDVIYEPLKDQRMVQGKPVYAEPSRQADSTFGFIRVYLVFQGDIKFSDIRGKYPTNLRLNRTPNADLIRIAILLHELAHLTDALRHTETEQTPEFDADILTICLGLGPVPGPGPRF